MRLIIIPGMGVDQTQPQTRQPTARLEIAHVLFTDIVGYSRLPIDEQTRLLRLLQEIVRSTREFREAQVKDQLISLPTGDGMALVFFGSPEDPAECAVEIGRALREQPELKLRMGVHSGPVYCVADINASRNVAGGGINTAQRVMDCGDSGHILVSDAVSKTLGELSKWAGKLQDLGEAEVKHGVRVHVFNLVADGAGNPEVPQKLRRRRKAGAPAKRAGAAAAGVAAVVVLAALASAYVWFFSSPRTEPASGVRPVNAAAYDYYLRGKVNIGDDSRANNETAIKLLEQAVSADPNFAPAYAELARAYNVKAFYFASDAEKKKLNEDAEVAVAKALALNPDLAEGHFARGLLLWTHSKRFPHELAVQSYKRALALNPEFDEAHHQLGLVYLHIGLLDKGWEEIERALAVNPGNTMARFRFGVIHLYRAEYEEALAFFNSSPLDINPALMSFQKATALFQLGRTQEASEVVEEYLYTYPTDEGGTVTSVKAMILAKAGREREAEETILRAEEIGKGFGHFHHTAYNIGSAYALLGKPEQAIKWLQAAADDGFPCYPLFENDANLNSLRKDERFRAFMAKLKQQWERYIATL